MPQETSRTKNLFDLYLADHGFIRVCYLNLHAIDKNRQFFRAAQPAPYQIKKLADKGIKTILNLRGKRNCGSYRLEREACEKYGITLIDFPLSSRDTPKKEDLHKLAELFDTMEYPALMHCKSGADRTGLSAALYLLLHDNEPLDICLKQLSLKYGHVKQAKTGMLDFFFEEYQKAHEAEGLAFFDWVDNHYDRMDVKERFMSGWLANIIINKILRRE